MTDCDRCGRELEQGDAFTHLGQTLCEDCYMDALNPPKGCDPWAVYTAKRSMGKEATLTPLQEKIVDLLKKEGPQMPGDLQSRLQISEAELKRAFAALRHMERVKAMKKDAKVFYTLFHK